MSDQLDAPVMVENSFAQEEPHIESQQEDAIEQPVKKTDTRKEENLRILRERAEAAERKAYELERLIQEKQANAQDEEEDWGLNDDSFVEGKDLKKYVKNLKKAVKTTAKQLEELQQKTSFEQAELRLKSRFPDFEEVVTMENLEKLRYSDPVEYNAVIQSSNLYDKGYLAYKRIRESRIYDSEMAGVDKRIEQNKVKPRASSNVSPKTGDTPLARVGDYDRRILTEEQKDIIRQRVEEAKRNKV